MPDNCFVQFIHPGGEHVPEDGRVKRWNTWPHRRKFLLQRGTYLENEMPHTADLMFWGEWEPESAVVKTFDHWNRELPHYLYQPYIVLPTAGNWLQNTDPFVFGDQFHYTCCQQWANGRPTQLRHLDKGAVVLFGSCIARSVFVIDTVFVVDHWIDYSVDTRDHVRDHVSPTYYDATLARVSAGWSYRLYFGATIDRPVRGMYSFFPCLPYTEQPRGFARPTIQLDGVITDTLTQGKRLNQGCSLDRAATLWRQVRDQVEVQGLCIGVATTLPERRNPDGTVYREQVLQESVERRKRC